MGLVARKRGDVADVEVDALTRGVERELAALAAEVLRRSGTMRNAGHARSGGELDPVDLHTRDRMRQELVDASLAASAGGGRQRALAKDLEARARCAQELLDGELERARDAREHGERRVRGAGLEVRDRRARYTRDPRELRLRETAALSNEAYVGGEVLGRVAHEAAEYSCYNGAMRSVTHRYVDPLDAVWLAAASRIGLRVARSPDVYASTDGKGVLVIGAAETLDPDDCLAQMILHELCHSLVEGPDSLERADWGLDNRSDRDLEREHACLLLQATLTAPLGLRRVLAPTTEHRAYYDALPPDPLAGRDDAVALLARRGAVRAERPPWAPHLGDALARTRAIADAVPVELPPLEGARSLFELLDDAAPLHPTGLPIARSANRTCGECAWSHRGPRARSRDRCHELDGARIDPSWPACDRFEASLECTTCAACCREAYGAVDVGRRDPAARRHPELVERVDGRLALRRDGDRCAALDGGRSAGEPFACRIYEDRPRTCHDFVRGGPHCLTARRRVGLSR